MCINTYWALFLIYSYTQTHVQTVRLLFENQYSQNRSIINMASDSDKLKMSRLLNLAKRFNCFLLTGKWLTIYQKSWINSMVKCRHSLYVNADIVVIDCVVQWKMVFSDSLSESWPDSSSNNRLLSIYRRNIAAENCEEFQEKPARFFNRERFISLIHWWKNVNLPENWGLWLKKGCID